MTAVCIFIIGTANSLDNRRLFREPAVLFYRPSEAEFVSHRIAFFLSKTIHYLCPESPFSGFISASGYSVQPTADQNAGWRLFREPAVLFFSLPFQEQALQSRGVLFLPV
jgi:hypothetical protein